MIRWTHKLTILLVLLLLFSFLMITRLGSTSPPTRPTGSTCSQKATDRGPGQKVISFSLYGTSVGAKPSIFMQGLEKNIDQIEVLYGPDWIVRLYHNVESNDYRYPVLSRFQYLHPHLDLCYVGNLPYIGNLLGGQGNMWRFLPIGDPLVDVFHSRDLDSISTIREMEAVNQFHEDKGAIFHAMRDHRFHRAVVLAGMWGMKVSFDRDLSWSIHQQLYKMMKTKKHKSFDQEVLRDVLLPHLNGSSLIHDSYFCGLYHITNTVPFPSRRNETHGLNFVGAVGFGSAEPYLEDCPPPCRLIKTWKYC